MDKYDKKLLNLVGKVADRISENAMILIVSVSFVIAAFLAQMAFNYSGKNKYGASKVTFMGETYDSRYERDRALYLKDLQRHGQISGLRRQVRFVIITKTTAVVPVQMKTKVKYVERVVEQQADYHCDFLYKENGRYVIEEFKSQMTAKLADYILRRKLMVKKVHEHNMKGRSQWVFREVVYSGKRITITDK